MNEYLDALKRGAIRGAKSAPGDFFFPLTWLFKKIFSEGDRQAKPISRHPDAHQEQEAEKSEKNRGKAAHS
ncbi:hypothetical protein R5576_15210 [Xanthomonas euvesicatoria]|uniref:Uncharacterized protein n=1 Tax=Xanthomonas euvesicatoria TaxID=456327 RepID=A0AAX4FP01_XANEU|nr:hypothetical protein [Xanthomonas euvesicatoria]WOP49276.1 hypothetical protein R2B60_06025 [Xanthomonas euvesicatoria]WOP51431.1 hypothetical protein R5576_15210 [Xanthomonas euvesicatoria]WOP57732.1 hypothetical protein R5577_06215 [Xanthomonas euvesicatoria]